MIVRRFSVAVLAATLAVGACKGDPPPPPAPMMDQDSLRAYNDSVAAAAAAAVATAAAAAAADDHKTVPTCNTGVRNTEKRARPKRARRF